ncbi:hypothetical protein GCM10010094_91840 [Streptomyces flaveus]|uniref:Uncharacterized protein n=1 Tax=Streptomyces flaveus TaxID=66370 RepID=A0A917VUZ9_9ACTN|nr:hypothetical protein GCM10010094_91840 [Streptomyces flaveus]
MIGARRAAGRVREQGDKRVLAGANDHGKDVREWGSVSPPAFRSATPKEHALCRCGLACEESWA